MKREYLASVCTTIVQQLNSVAGSVSLSVRQGMEDEEATD